MTGDTSLGFLLDGLEHAAQGESVSVRDVLHEFGDRAITPFMLILAVLLVSPLSGIPGVPSISAVIMILLAVQALVGRRQLWLPDFLLRREVASHRLRSGIGWLRRPCGFVDRHARPRLTLLATGPMRGVALLVVILIAAGWPPLEVLPMVTSVGALVVAFLTFGLFTRDGVYVLLGYAVVALTLGGVWLALF